MINNQMVLMKNPKRNIDHTEELETLKASITENEELIRQLELQLQKLEESTKKVKLNNNSNHISIVCLF